jgi:hypothetical protein
MYFHQDVLPNAAMFTLAENRRHRGTGQPASSPISSPPSTGEGGRIALPAWGMQFNQVRLQWRPCWQWGQGCGRQHYWCQAKEELLSPLPQQCRDSPLHRAFPQCLFTPAPQCLTPTHLWLLWHCGLLIKHLFVVPLRALQPLLVPLGCNSHNQQWLHHLPGCWIFPTICQRHSSLCLLCLCHHNRRSARHHMHPPKQMLLQPRGPGIMMMMMTMTHMLILQVNMMLRTITSTSHPQRRIVVLPARPFIMGCREGDD